jgi:ABC-type dipeptide/oligopeptide/nickel transport system permease subunit
MKFPGGAVPHIARSPGALAGATILSFWVAAAVLAGSLAPHPPDQMGVPALLPGTLSPDGAMFWLGTDHLGRDILSRILYGARTVLLIAPSATLLSYVIGVPMGLLAGYLGGWVDMLLSSVANVILSFPVLILYILIITTLGASVANIFFSVAFASLPGITRIVRSLATEIRSKDYIAAAKMRGENTWWIVIVEILPNAKGPLIVDFCLRVGYVTIAIGVLGFLGLGVPPPTPDWGSMVNEVRQMALTYPHMALFPCLAISSLVVALNLLADGLQRLAVAD